jgi:protein MBA1
VVFLKWDAKRDPLTGKKMRKPMELDSRVAVAKDMHERFHVALGQGDMKILQAICCEGLLSTARTRIDKRKAMSKGPRKYAEWWKLMGYNGWKYWAWLDKWPLSPLLPNSPARVVSDRLAPLPVADTYIRQCIVRIRSVQQYELADADQSTTRSHTDYVVIQKITTKGQDGEWKLWGLTEPTTMDEIDTMLAGGAKEVGATLAERIQDKLSNLTGV